MGSTLPPQMIFFGDGRVPWFVGGADCDCDCGDEDLVYTSATMSTMRWVNLRHGHKLTTQHNIKQHSHVYDG